MAQIKRWKSYHVRITTLEKILGHRLVSLRTMFPEGDEDIAIRLPQDRWSHYGIDKAMEQLGFNSKKIVVYINLR